jgi:arginyl-tRNA synthetase
VVLERIYLKREWNIGEAEYNDYNSYNNYKFYMDTTNTKTKLQKIIAEVAGFDHPSVEFTSDSQFGDYTTNIAMVDRSQITVHGSPRKVADNIVEKLKNNDAAEV